VEAGIFRDSSIEADLMTLNETVGSKDPLARFLSARVLPWYHRMLGHRLHRSMAEKAFERTWEYRPEIMVQVGNTICMLLSAVIPALSILVLFVVHSMGARLVAISMMSLVFSLVMNVIAQRRADVFMSTTAFAAVLVVFVGSANVMSG
jgi:Flp pilus assembly protein TadB